MWHFPELFLIIVFHCFPCFFLVLYDSKHWYFPELHFTLRFPYFPCFFIVLYDTYIFVFSWPLFHHRFPYFSFFLSLFYMTLSIYITFSWTLLTHRFPSFPCFFFVLVLYDTENLYYIFLNLRFPSFPCFFPLFYVTLSIYIRISVLNNFPSFYTPHVGTHIPFTKTNCLLGDILASHKLLYSSSGK